MKRGVRAGLVAAGLVVAGCATGAEDDRARDPSPVERPTTTAAVLEPPPRFVVDPAEPAADLKQLAVDVVSAVGTYTDGSDLDAAVDRAGAALAPGALPPDNPLLGAGDSTSEVIYPQLGGLTETDASVMLVLRHRTLDGASVASVTRTVDVRVRREPAGPMVIGFGSFGGDPIDGAAPSHAAQQVLAIDRIELPDSARWDVLAGRVDDRVLATLADLSAGRRLHVTVFSSGHPVQVFGTDDVSNHTEGRGVDIWAIDGRPVFELRESVLVADLVKRALAAGLTEVGAPVDIDGAGGSNFTNLLHQDHLHLAYDR